MNARSASSNRPSIFVRRPLRIAFFAMSFAKPSHKRPTALDLQKTSLGSSSFDQPSHQRPTAHDLENTFLDSSSFAEPSHQRPTAHDLRKPLIDSDYTPSKSAIADLTSRAIRISGYQRLNAREDLAEILGAGSSEIIDVGMSPVAAPPAVSSGLCGGA